MKKLLLLTSFILLISLLAACTNGETAEEEETEEEKVIAVETAEVKEGNLTVEKKIYGRTEPHRSAPVMLTAPGEIDSLEVTNGDKVEENDLIAVIKTQMGNQNIRAKEDGVILGLKAKEGDLASSEEPLAIIADLDAIRIQAGVTANMLDILAVDDKVTAKVNGKKYEATVTSVDRLPDDTGLYPVAFAIDEEDTDIAPGIVAELIIPEEKVKSALIVPTASLVEEKEETFVYVVQNDHVKKVPVKPIEVQSKNSAIEGKVKAGDKIVVSGQLGLADGQQVEVLKGE